MIAAATLVITFFSYRFLLQNDRAKSGNKLILGKPDPYIAYLGLLVFFAGICEGGMFDWSGIYLQGSRKSGNLYVGISHLYDLYGESQDLHRIGSSKKSEWPILL